MISLQNNSKIALLGKEYGIIFSDKKLLKPRVNIESSSIYVFQSDLNQIHHKYILEKHLKDFAKKTIIARTRFLAMEHSFSINKIAVRNQSSRWGSCSSVKNINLNWRLIFAPCEVMDYVIIHELCHTVEMNHSKRFWDQVESKMGSWKACRKWLRENGKELEIRD